MSDEYAELARELLDKMGEFIRESQPGEALIPLHKAYSVVKNTVDAADPDSERSKRKRELEDARRALEDLREQNRLQKDTREAGRAQQEQERREYEQQRHAWFGLDRTVKMGRILSALGEDALIRREMLDRLTKAHPDARIYENDLVGLLNEMLTMGDLEREKEPRGPNCSITARGGYRWRWRRSRPEMSPELQGLEQQLKEA